MFKLDLEKAQESEIKLSTSAGSSKKQESSRKTSSSDLLNMPKPLTVWTKTNSGKFFKRWEYQTTWPASWEICMKVRKQQLELDMEQQTGSKWGKEYIKATDTEPTGVRADYGTTFYMRDLSIHGFWHLWGVGPGTSTPQGYWGLTPSNTFLRTKCAI